MSDPLQTPEPNVPPTGPGRQRSSPAEQRVALIALAGMVAVIAGAVVWVAVGTAMGADFLPALACYVCLVAVGAALAARGWTPKGDT